MKTLFTAFTATLLLASTSPLFAHEPPPENHPVHTISMALQLSEEQAADFRNLLQVRAEANDATNAQIDQLQTELADLLAGGAPDPAQVGSLVLDMHQLRSELGLHQDEFLAAFHALLTPEQGTQLMHINQLAMAQKAAEALHEVKLH